MKEYLQHKIQSIPISTAIKLGIIFVWGVWTAFFALNATIHIPTFHIDGTFQTASGLYRLDGGQFPGRDFFPYLGIGVLYALFPLFKILGANIASSIFSAYFTVSCAGMISTAFVWHIIWRHKSFITSMAIICAIQSIFEIINGEFHHLSPYISFWMTPGNSLRPLRSFVPYMAAIFFYFFILRIALPWKKYAAAGLVTALIMLWSNDYALSTACLFGMLILITGLVSKELSVKHALLYLITSIAFWIAFFALLTAGHPLEMLKYNLEVANGQWWYFGWYTESERVFSIREVSLLLNVNNAIGLLVLAFVALLAWKKRTIEYALLVWLGIGLFCGGLVASVGGHLEKDYFKPFHYFAILVLIFGSAKAIWDANKERLSVVRLNNRAAVIVGIAFLFIPMWAAALSSGEYRESLSKTREGGRYIYVDELGGYLPEEWRGYIQLARTRPQNLLVFEEYWGIWSAIRRTNSSWPVDSVIHAFQSVRESAKIQLHDADIIISTRNNTDPLWMPWSLSQNYWFYEELLKKWEVEYLSPTTAVWKKTGAVRKFEAVNCEPDLERNLIVLSVPETGFYEMHLSYRFQANSFRNLLMLRNNINYAAGADGYVSADPDDNQITFPVYFEKVGQNIIDAKVLGGSASKFLLESCSMSRMTFSNLEILQFPSENSKLIMMRMDKK